MNRRTIKPEIYEELGLPEGMELRTLDTKFDNKYNSKRKKANHLRRISQHLQAFFAHHYPDMEIVNFCPEIVKKMRGNSSYFIFVYKKDGQITIAPMDYGTKKDVLFASVFQTLHTLGIEERDIITIYYVMYPKTSDMTWEEWRENASDGILADGCSLFRSLDYYERLAKYNENPPSSRRRR